MHHIQKITFKGEYQEAKKLLINLRFKDQISELAVRILLLKVYFEIQDFDLLDALIDSLLVYLRRGKLLSYHKENYYNIIKAVQKLNAHNFYDKEEQAKLKEELETMQPLTERVWLLEMLERR